MYVNDIIVIGDVFEVDKLKEFLACEFEIKSLGNLIFILGIEVARS